MIVIAAFANAGLAHSTAVLAATPILVTLLSIPMLGERVGWRRWSAIIAGLVGVLLILKPDASGFPRSVAAAAGGLLRDVCDLPDRDPLVSRTDAPATSFFYIGVAGA
jgi:drug/metabolite transporter (DMT)-like permease